MLWCVTLLHYRKKYCLAFICTALSQYCSISSTAWMFRDLKLSPRMHSKVYVIANCMENYCEITVIVFFTLRLCITSNSSLHLSVKKIGMQFKKTFYKYLRMNHTVHKCTCCCCCNIKTSKLHFLHHGPWYYV